MKKRWIIVAIIFLTTIISIVYNYIDGIKHHITQNKSLLYKEKEKKTEYKKLMIYFNG